VSPLPDRSVEPDSEPERVPAATALAGAAAPAHAPAGLAGMMLGIQRGAGNQAAAQAARSFLARQAVAPPAPAAPALDPAEELKRAEAFTKGGPYKAEVTPGGAGAQGGFEADYNPTKGEMTVSMRCAVTFKHAIDDALTPADPALTPLVTKARRLRGAARRRFLAPYQWTPEEQEPWRTRLKTLIDDKWGRKFEFHLRKPQWEWIGAKTIVNIDVHDGPKAANDHLAITSIKFPEGQNLYSFNDDPANKRANRSGASFTGAGAGADPHDQTMTLASTDVGGRPDYNVLRTSVQFGINRHDLTPGAKRALDDWIASFEGKAGDARSVNQTVNLEGHASATGTADHNMELATKRVTTVSEYLGTHGFTNVATRATPNPKGAAEARGGEDKRDRRVDLVVGDGNPQSLAVHEFGHAFGLDDEYADTPLYGGSGKAVGDAVTHDATTKKMQDASGNKLPGAIAETSDSIMSAGNVVRPQHYSTFHAALCQITRETEWALGPPGARPAGVAPGAAPAPAPGVSPPPGPPPP
jgi:outer membrane protein OmpA-like peptidoglycan-associated protein